jgi:hypothetical protein
MCSEKELLLCGKAQKGISSHGCYKNRLFAKPKREANKEKTASQVCVLLARIHHNACGPFAMQWVYPWKSGTLN